MEAAREEIVSAFVDGEPVDPAALAEALAAPGARELLLDFVRLRVALADQADPPAAFVESMRARLAQAPGAAAFRRPLRLAAAAAVAVLALLGVRDLQRRVRSADGPPPAARVIRFEPGVDWHPGKVR